MRRLNGEGTLLRYPKCKRWVIQFYCDGKRIREATGLTSRYEAQKVLTQRLAEVGKGQYSGQVRPATVLQLWQAMVDEYRRNGQLRAVRDVGDPANPEAPQGKWKAVGPVFGFMRASRITTVMLDSYRKKRVEAGVAQATVNRDLGALRHAFNLARRQSPPRVASVPYFPMARENNVRVGFVEDTAYDKVFTAARDLWLRLYLELAYTFGWRDAELRGLQVRQVNLLDGTLRLDPGTTKNREGREVQLTSRLLELLKLATAGKPQDAYLITREDGSRVADMRWTWQSLFVAQGLGKLTCPVCTATVKRPTHRCPTCHTSVRLRYTGIRPHDFRRSAAKAMRRAGVPESVCMDIMGHKTNAMFKRYAIVSTSDRRQAVQLLEASAKRFKKGLIQDDTGTTPEAKLLKVQ
jgi:integrase